MVSMELLGNSGWFKDIFKVFLVLAQVFGMVSKVLLRYSMLS